MPKMNEQSDDKIIKKSQKTNTGIYINAGDISKENDTTPWETQIKDYDKMRISDPIITTTLDMLKFPIMQADYKIESKNKEVVDYMYWIFENLMKGLHYLKYHKLLCLDYGLSMHEMVIKRNDKNPINGKQTNRPIYFNPIQLHTIHKFLYDENTNFTGIEHEKIMPDKGSEFIPIDIKDLDWLTYQEEYNDIRGRSILRPVRLFHDIKHKTLVAHGISVQKGAGITLIGVNGNPGDADQGVIENIGRTVAQMQNGYVSYNKDKMSIDILEPKLAANAMPLVEYCDKSMFMNTMTQFMISGISGNGSRAATSEHKSSYENAAGYILSSLENNFQQITDKCIEMGCFYNLPDDEWPVFKFNSITQADLSRVASNINTLVSSGLVLTDADKAMIREQFGLPAIIASEAGTVAEDVNQNQVEEQQTMSKKVNVRKMSIELQAFENMVLDADSVSAHYDDVELKAKALMQDYTKLFFDDIKNQLTDNKDKNIIIKNALMFELTGKLQELYNSGLEKGKADVLSEVQKANTTSMALSKKLATTPESNKIERAVKKLFFDIKSTVEDMMQRFTVKTLELKGGIGVILESLTDGFKTDKNLISSVVESGYIDGRAITLNQLADNIETYIVTTKMDKSLCNECSPFDGLVGTKAEIIDLGLRMDHPVNPLCLGKDNCRCLILAYTLK